MTTVEEAIAQANAILPHVAAPEGELDLRWQAIIGVGEFAESDPMPVWEFTLQWASEADEDLQSALATCLLEHLLEYHFALLFPLVRRAAQTNRAVAGLVRHCWAFRDDDKSDFAAAFRQLQRECGAPAI